MFAEPWTRVLGFSHSLYILGAPSPGETQHCALMQTPTTSKLPFQGWLTSTVHGSVARSTHEHLAYDV